VFDEPSSREAPRLSALKQKDSKTPWKQAYLVWKYCGTVVELDEQSPDFFEALAPPRVLSPSRLFDSIMNVQKNTTQIPKNSNEFLKLWLNLELRCHVDFSSSSSPLPKPLYE
jgi:hypothetical protein